MRLPPKKKPGDLIKAEDWNLLLDAITARTPRSGSGLKLICASGGFAYSAPPESVTTLKHPPFSVIGIEKTDAAYLVTIKEGWVIERQPQSDIHPAVNFLMPTASGTALNATPRPQLTMSAGQTAWCRYETDTQGTITGTPTILLSSATNNGTHYSPQDPDESGTNGVYLVKLFLLNVTDGVVSVTPYQQSDIEHWGQLWTGQNVGSGKRVFKEYDEETNLYKFRTLLGISPVTCTEDGDVIKVEIDGFDANVYLYGRTVSYADGYVNGLGITTAWNKVMCYRSGVLVGVYTTEAAAEDALGEDWAAAYTIDILDVTLS